MNTTTLKERLGLDEEVVFEDGITATDDGMTDEELKIESLKIATNIGKLMSNVTTEDIVSIAETVAKFIKGGEGASLETMMIVHQMKIMVKQKKTLIQKMKKHQKKQMKEHLLQLVKMKKILKFNNIGITLFSDFVIPFIFIINRLYLYLDI